MDVKLAENRMCEIAQAVIDECDKKLAVLPQNAEQERVAQKIRRNMAKSCMAFVVIAYGSYDSAIVRRMFLEKFCDIKLPAEYPDAKIVYLHAVKRIENNFIKHYSKNLENAQKFNNDEEIFKLETQLEVVNYITAKWRELGKTEGLDDGY